MIYRIFPRAVLAILTAASLRSVVILAATIAMTSQLWAADPWEEMRRDAEKNPNEVTGCGVGESNHVYTTREICFDVMKLARDRKMEYSAASELLQMCSSLSTSICLLMVKEVQHLSDRSRTISKYVLIDECANDLEKQLPGNEKTQYLNACNEVMDLLN